MRLAAFGSLIIPVLLAAAVPGACAADKKPAPYGLIAGSVFRETGRSLAGAEIRVEPAAASESGTRIKIKKIEGRTDGRGEFAIRVPAEPMRYTLRVSAPGYQPQEKAVSINGEDRIDVFFTLEPASK